MFDLVDTLYSYERVLIICSFLQDISKGKRSSLQLICNAHTAFTLYGRPALSESYRKINLTILRK